MTNTAPFPSHSAGYRKASEILFLLHILRRRCCSFRTELSLAKMTVKTGWQHRWRWQHQWQQAAGSSAYHCWNGPQFTDIYLRSALCLVLLPLAFFTYFSALSFSCFYCPANDVSLPCVCVRECADLFSFFFVSFFLYMTMGN